MAIWYQQNLNGMALGPIYGQDGWTLISNPAFLNSSREMFLVSDTHTVSSGHSLSCESGGSNPSGAVPGLAFIRKPLEEHNDALGYSAEFKYKVIESGSASNVFQVRMVQGSTMSWVISIGGNRVVRTATWNPDTNSYAINNSVKTLDLATVYTIRVVVGTDSSLALSIYSGSPEVVLNGYARFPMGNALYMILSCPFNPLIAPPVSRAALDDLILEYTPAVVAAPATPLPPANVMVNSRANYNVVSWNRVVNGVVQEIITRGATGDYTDSVTNVSLSSSPVVTQAIIGGETAMDAADLPVEGETFTVDRGAGTITWSTTSPLRPDFNTPYTVRYEVPITNVTGYRVYKSTLLNEDDRALYTVVTGYDAENQVDTAFVDTDIKEASVYRIAAINADMVESEVSEKVIAIKSASQADDKTEVVDRKLFTLDHSLLDEGILR